MDIGRNGDFFDRHLGPRAIANRHDVDADARLGEHAGLLQPVADVFVAVGEHDDAALGIRQEVRLSHPERGGQVRVLAVDPHLFVVGQRQVLVIHGAIDRRVAAEDDRPGPIVAPLIAMLGDLLPRIIDHHRLERLGDAQRLVEQIDDSHPIADPVPLQLGQRRDDQQQHERPQSNRHNPPHIPQRRQAAKAQHPQQRQQAQQDKPAGGIEAEAEVEHAR